MRFTSPFLPPRRWSASRLMMALAGILLAAAETQADTQYKMQPIVKYGDTVAGVNVKVAGGAFLIHGLTDSGLLAFTTWVAEFPNGIALIQYADGKFTPVAVADTDGPAGKWPKNLVLYEPASLNQRGDLVFSAKTPAIDGGLDLGTYRWDAKAQKAIPIARREMPASSNLTFVTGGWWSPTLNNRDEIAFPAVVKDNTTGDENVGAFLASPDGTILPVAVPGQTLPDGKRVEYIEQPHLTDAGTIVFMAHRESEADDGRNSAYLWEKGTITPLLMAQSDAPGGKKITRIAGAWVNDRNRSVLIAAHHGSPVSLYLHVDGTLKPVAVRNQEMPGGGQFRDIPLLHYGISPPSSLGQYAFVATLTDGNTAAYLMDADGALSLILKSGMDTELGKITRVGKTSFTSADPRGVPPRTERQGPGGSARPDRRWSRHDRAAHAPGAVSDRGRPRLRPWASA